MTHDELKAKIFQEYATTYEDLCGNVPMSPKALLAVVELHYPTRVSWASSLDYCMECSNWKGRDPDLLREYPCQTIEAIEKE